MPLILTPLLLTKSTVSFKMKRLISFMLLSCTLCLILPGTGTSTTLATGGLQSTSTSGPETIVLNIAANAMKITMLKSSNYFTKNGKLAPANLFLQKPKSPSPIKLITNDAKGAVTLVFSQNAPGGLKGKKIRCVIPSSPISFISPVCITDIDQDNSGQPFFSNPTQNFTPSITIMGTDLGTVYTAPSSAVKSMNYNSIDSNVNSASHGSSNAPGSSSSSSSIGAT